MVVLCWIVRNFLIEFFLVVLSLSIRNIVLNIFDDCHLYQRLLLPCYHIIVIPVMLLFLLMLDFVLFLSRVFLFDFIQQYSCEWFYRMKGVMTYHLVWFWFQNLFFGLFLVFVICRELSLLYLYYNYIHSFTIFWLN